MALADRVNLGPLTTVFTPPAACATAIFDNDKLGWRDQRCIDDGGSLTDNKECWPGTKRGFHSPGLYCPEGYTTACTASVKDGITSTGWKAQYPLEDGETAVGCCPTGFRCGDLDGGRQTCILRWGTLSFEQPTAKCKDGQLTDFGTMTFPGRKPDLFAGMVQINWKASDRDESATTTTTSAESSATAPNSDSTSASASASRSSPDLVTITRTVSGSLTTETLDSTGSKEEHTNTDTDKPAMSKGAVAGTVVGVFIFILFFPIGWLFRRNQQKKHAAETSPEAGDDSDATTDLSRSLVGTAASKPPGSSAAGQPQQVYTDYPVQEIPGDYKPYGMYSVSQLEDTKTTSELPLHHEIHEAPTPGGVNTMPELPGHNDIHEVHVPGAHTTPELPTERSAYEVAGTVPTGPIHHSVNDAPWSPVDQFEVSATPVDPNRPGSGVAGGR